MIHVQRTAAPPEVVERLRLSAHEAEKAFHEFRSRQTRFAFKDSSWSAASAPLHQLFHGKCAYCETPIGKRLSGKNVDHFRPKLGAMDLRMHVDRDHYYWLAYEWSNLYLACSECELNKKTLFPVAGKRAGVGDDITQERPLLLDPCADDPSAHLQFEESGRVSAKSERGSVTIDLLGLNRRSLVAYRALAVRDAKARLLRGADPAKLAEPAVPYAGAVRALIASWAAPQRNVAVGRVTRRVEKRRPASGTAAAASTPFARTGGFLKKVTLRNFKGVEKLSVDIVPSHGEEQAGWLMLLGENAAGKSSILQAVALALSGRSGLADFTPESLDALIRNGQETATITVETSAEPSLIRLQLRRGKPPAFLRGGDGYPGLLLAYGATRLAGASVRQKVAASAASGERRILNLFNPRIELTPAEPWLRHLWATNRTAFHDAAKTLKSLLRITTVDVPLSVQRNRVLLDHGNGPVTLDQLSAGYHSMLGLGIDIMQASPDQTSDKIYVSGVVVLDEIDAHLHPRWKMDVVRLLRDAFPRIQFIVSTHEPLCLRGTREKEVILMRRNENDQLEAIANLPAHERMRVDQLLTSPLFGLHTTLDPAIEQEFREYYAILAKEPLSRTDAENARVDVLKPKLTRHGVLGYTRRDQMVYELIDEYLAHEPLLSIAKRAQWKGDTRRKVLSIWRHVEAGSTGA